MATPRVVDRLEAARPVRAPALYGGGRVGPSDIARGPAPELPTAAQRVVANPVGCSRALLGRRYHGLAGASSTEAADLLIRRWPSARNSALLAREVQVPMPTNVETRAGLAPDPRVNPTPRTGRPSRSSVGPSCCLSARPTARNLREPRACWGPQQRNR